MMRIVKKIVPMRTHDNGSSLIQAMALRLTRSQALPEPMTFTDAYMRHQECSIVSDHDDVIKWKHFPRYWPFVRGIHWSR